MVRQARFAGPREVLWRQWREDRCPWGMEELEAQDLKRLTPDDRERTRRRKLAASKRRRDRLHPDRPPQQQ